MRTQRLTTRTVTTLAATLAAAVLTLLTGALPAAAHAELVSSTPAAGATVDRLPRAVTLTFSEPVRTPVFVEVTGPSGADIARGDARVRDADVTQAVERSTQGGRYALSYRVTSADGHAISGTVRFTLASPAAGGDDARQSPQAAPTEPVGTQPADEAGGGLGTGALVLLLAALAVGLGALALGTRRALQHSATMVADGKSRRSRQR